MDIVYKLKQLIQLEGKIKISTFMNEIIASQSGYYNSNIAFGRQGDFTTSPEISQLFGEMVGLWVYKTWENLGLPKEIALIELGPGNGTLMDDVIRTIKKFAITLNIHFVEISDRLAQVQKEKLSKYNIPKFWYKSIDEIKTNLPVIFIANEFFDAVPIVQYIKLKNRFYEIYIGLDHTNFDFNFIYASLNRLEEENLNLDYPNAENNAVIEVSRASIDIVKQMQELIQSNKGAAFIADYGYIMPNYDRKLTNSTIQAVKDHKFHPIFSNIGEADISAHVDFYALAQAVTVKGSNVKLMTQREFLIDSGINIRAEILTKNLDSDDKIRIFQSVDRLTSSNHMGELFKVMLID